jgi:hypothetical protein
MEKKQGILTSAFLFSKLKVEWRASAQNDFI